MCVKVLCVAYCSAILGCRCLFFSVCLFVNAGFLLVLIVCIYCVCGCVISITDLCCCLFVAVGLWFVGFFFCLKNILIKLTID